MWFPIVVLFLSTSVSIISPPFKERSKIEGTIVLSVSVRASVCPCAFTSCFLGNHWADLLQIWCGGVPSRRDGPIQKSATWWPWPWSMASKTENRFSALSPVLLVLGCSNLVCIHNGLWRIRPLDKGQGQSLTLKTFAHYYFDLFLKSTCLRLLCLIFVWGIYFRAKFIVETFCNIHAY